MEKNKVRYNHKARHYGVVKKKRGKKITFVFMSTKPINAGKRNIPMQRNADPNMLDASFFMTRPRTYDSGNGPIQKNMSLTNKDKRLSDQIYKNHLKNSKEQRKRKRTKKK